MSRITFDVVPQIKCGSQPEFYKIHGPRHYFRETLLIRKIKKWISGDKVLDAGFGPGSLTLRLGKEGFQVEAVDLDNALVQYARAKARKMKLSHRVNINNVGDITTNIGFPDESFDAVVCGEVLEHIQQDVLAVHEFYRVLKAGGIVVASVPAHQRMWDDNDVCSGHIRRYEKEQLVKLFEDNNLKIEYVRFWGFPVSRLFHKCAYLNIVCKRGNKICKERLSYINKIPWFNRLLSYFLWLDNLFNWTYFGIGLIIVGRK